MIWLIRVVVRWDWFNNTPSLKWERYRDRENDNNAVARIAEWNRDKIWECERGYLCVDLLWNVYACVYFLPVVCWRSLTVTVVRGESSTGSGMEATTTTWWDARPRFFFLFAPMHLLLTTEAMRFPSGVLLLCRSCPWTEMLYRRW